MYKWALLGGGMYLAGLPLAFYYDHKHGGHNRKMYATAGWLVWLFLGAVLHACKAGYIA